MRKLSHSEIKSQRKDLTNISQYKRNPIRVIAESIRSIYNVGAIFRSSDGAFIDKLYLTGYTPHPPRKEIEKVALGATLSVPWEYHKETLPLIEKIKSEGYKICVLELTDSSRKIWDAKKSDFPVCLVLGNEITGVSSEVINSADAAFDIPMLGIKQSLNVSVAYGIAVYELLRVINT